MKTQILGRFEPTEYQPGCVADEFKQWARKHQFPLVSDSPYWGMEVRAPEINTYYRTSDPDYSIIGKWHRDDAGADGNHLVPRVPGMHLILWSNATPTEVMQEGPDGAYHELDFKIKPFDVVLINNDECVHRMPDVVDENRWFIRQICYEKKGNE